MNRRDTVLALAALGIAPSALWAQKTKSIPRIGYLVVDNPEPFFGYFKDGLRKLGYQEGRNMQIDSVPRQENRNDLRTLRRSLSASKWMSWSRR